MEQPSPAPVVSAVAADHQNLRLMGRESLHAFVTIAIPFDVQNADAVDVELEAISKQCRGDDGEIRKALRGKPIHFISVTVVRGDAAEPTHLVLELSADGDAASAIAVIATSLSPWIAQIVGTAGLAPPLDLASFLARHQIKAGQGLFDTPGLNFTGHPTMTVERIRREHDLAREIRTYFDQHPAISPALQSLSDVRNHIAAKPDLKPLLQAEPLPRLAPSGETSPAFFAGVALRGVWKFFWPLIVGLLLATILIVLQQPAFWPKFMAMVFCLVVSVFLLVAVIGYFYAALRKAETANLPDDSLPDAAVLADVVAHENKTTQNHLAGISRMQRGWIRFFSLRIAFWLIGEMATRIYKPGFLADIGTIHFARWVLLPKTNKLLFFSNYGGSWESYLEDFITKAANGLTAAWSNTIGFPKSRNLFQGGAVDGDRFKRWARRQQQPTRFWYSAYPHLTTARVRNNAAIRQGLATASTSDEAKAWFSLFGSAAPLPSAIESTEVQSLLFGGFSNHSHAACLILQLPDEVEAARNWLSAMLSTLSFGDDPPKPDTRILCLAQSGLTKLGLPSQTQNNFPIAFRQGMAHPTRAEILSDTGKDAPGNWAWGNGSVDCAILIYATDAKLLSTQQRDIAKLLKLHGGSLVHKISLAEMALERDAAGRRKSAFEAFGFADGISQPIIRGTRRFLKSADTIHLVEPGEFILGYPNNRGDVAPAITVAATADPHQHLPVANPGHAGAMLPDFNRSGDGEDRDFARNGSFLVIRQLDQKTEVFEKFAAAAAEKLESHPAMPSHLVDNAQRQHWIAAKMVGRWKDGTSLVRYPHRPGSGWQGEFTVPPDNDFLLGAEDPSGLRCPYGAHVRRANPRDSFDPGSAHQLAISNRHRILRVGRSYKAEGSGTKEQKNPGLLFMCFNGDLERQFEFIQQTWSMAWQFHGLENEVDPILVRGADPEKSDKRQLARLTIPTTHGPIQIGDVADFIDVRGGGYFFMPSLSALKFLSQSQHESEAASQV